MLVQTSRSARNRDHKCQEKTAAVKGRVLGMNHIKLVTAPGGGDKRTVLIVEGPCVWRVWPALMAEALRKTLGSAWLYDIVSHVVKQPGDCPYNKEQHCLALKSECRTDAPGCHLSLCHTLLADMRELITTHWCNTHPAD